MSHEDEVVEEPDESIMSVGWYAPLLIWFSQIAVLLAMVKTIGAKSLSAIVTTVAGIFEIFSG